MARASVYLDAAIAVSPDTVLRIASKLKANPNASG